MKDRVFVGFGFGAIQGGLFLYEAHRARGFERLVVAEVVQPVVDAVRGAGGRFHVNVATAQGVEKHEVEGVEIYNPAVPEDARKLTDALAAASEIATALPSVEFYARGTPTVAGLLADALRRKLADPDLPAAVIYTAENNNHAAEILERACGVPAAGRAQFLNTVVGKMSGVVTDPAALAAAGLAPVTEGAGRAFLVEAFNRILITQIALPGFERGLGVFEEKPDLLPFEEAKLYGHNAVHALLGYLAWRKGYPTMAHVAGDEALLRLGREAFLEESGGALIARHAGVDPLFTPAGYRAYAEDLLERMMCPYLDDQVARVVRDPSRKLAWDDRLVGVMRLALDAGIRPERFARGAAAALELLCSEEGGTPEERLESLWPQPDEPAGRKGELRRLILEGGITSVPGLRQGDGDGGL